MKTKKTINVRNKAYFKEGHERNRALLELMQTVNGSISIGQLAKKLGWYEPTVRASMTFLVNEGLVEVIELTRVNKEYALLKERSEF